MVRKCDRFPGDPNWYSSGSSYESSPENDQENPPKPIGCKSSDSTEVKFSTKMPKGSKPHKSNVPKKVAPANENQQAGGSFMQTCTSCERPYYCDWKQRRHRQHLCTRCYRVSRGEPVAFESEEFSQGYPWVSGSSHQFYQQYHLFGPPEAPNLQLAGWSNSFIQSQQGVYMNNTYEAVSWVVHKRHANPFPWAGGLVYENPTYYLQPVQQEEYHNPPEQVNEPNLSKSYSMAVSASSSKEASSTKKQANQQQEWPSLKRSTSPEDDLPEETGESSTQYPQSPSWAEVLASSAPSKKSTSKQIPQTSGASARKVCQDSRIRKPAQLPSNTTQASDEPSEAVDKMLTPLRTTLQSNKKIPFDGKSYQETSSLSQSEAASEESKVIDDTSFQESSTSFGYTASSLPPTSELSEIWYDITFKNVNDPSINGHCAVVSLKNASAEEEHNRPLESPPSTCSSPPGLICIPHFTVFPTPPEVEEVIRMPASERFRVFAERSCRKQVQESYASSSTSTEASSKITSDLESFQRPLSYLLGRLPIPPENNFPEFQSPVSTPLSSPTDETAEASTEKSTLWPYCPISAWIPEAFGSFKPSSPKPSYDITLENLTQKKESYEAREIKTSAVQQEILSYTHGKLRNIDESLERLSKKLWNDIEVELEQEIQYPGISKKKNFAWPSTDAFNKVDTLRIFVHFKESIRKEIEECEKLQKVFSADKLKKRKEYLQRRMVSLEKEKTTRIRIFEVQSKGTDGELGVCPFTDVLYFLHADVYDKVVLRVLAQVMDVEEWIDMWKY